MGPSMSFCLIALVVIGAMGETARVRRRAVMLKVQARWI